MGVPANPIQIHPVLVESMVWKFFGKLEFFPFLCGLAVGIFVVYILKPAPMVIQKIPNLENAGSLVYKDRNGTCFTYDAKEVNCDKVEDKIKPFSLQ